MKKKISTEYSLIIILAVILIFLGVWYVGFKDTNETVMSETLTEKTVTFSCSTGTFTLTYAPDRQTAEITLGAEEYTLTSERAASGIRYSDSDSTISFNEHQGEARVALDDTVIFEGCTPQS